MNKRKIIIISRKEEVGRYYKQELDDFFKGDLQILNLKITDNLKQVSTCDLVLITTHSILHKIMPYTTETSKVIKITKNLNPSSIEEIYDLPIGVEALVVNVGPKTVSESIYLIYSHGRTDLELYPYYPGIESYKETPYILTQGELDIVPKYDAQILDLKNCIIDSKTYVEIISALKLDKAKYLSRIFDRGNFKISDADSLSMVISERFMFENIINALFENLKEGVIIYNEVGAITSCSLSVQRFLKKTVDELNGYNVRDILELSETVIFGEQMSEHILTIKSSPLICNVLPNFSIGTKRYGLVTLKHFNEAELKIHSFKQELKKKGHQSKYGIKDIIGDSNEISALKEYALRVAKSESTVIVFGESGTGKELFAHAIHNNSRRCNEQFIAVNCSAIPDNLLESQLFGYEDGAFTGAKKGGLKGLFENANGGTLFLDEIGEVPMQLQNRLLRVLQEKEIMRIGGNSIIKTDVRIIAATNVDLKKQVEMGNFRKDLYYRLCVLPLSLPPLRDRGKDVLQIFQHMIDKEQVEMVLELDAEAFFLTYEWDGNIRELSNCVEYLVNLGKQRITLEDLPENMRSAHLKEKVEPIQRNLVFSKGEETTVEIDVDMIILRIILERARLSKKAGRKQIALALKDYNIFLGEQEVRSRLLILKDRGLVHIAKGRGGTSLTQFGIEYMTGK